MRFGIAMVAAITGYHLVDVDSHRPRAKERLEPADHRYRLRPKSRKPDDELEPHVPLAQLPDSAVATGASTLAATDFAAAAGLAVAGAAQEPLEQAEAHA